MLLLLVPAGWSCKKLIAVPPPATSVTGSTVFTEDATAISVLNGIYETMSASGPGSAGSIPSLSMYTGLSGDELGLWSGSPSLMAISYYRNALTGIVGGYGSEYWSGLYPLVASCNAAINGLSGPVGLTPAVRQQLLGEACFLRGLFFFYLVNLYGDVAMPLSGAYPADASLSRTRADSVYQQILADLHRASLLLSVQWTDGTLLNPGTERLRPTKWAAMAMLARTYLYTADWTDAKLQADSVINNAGSFSLCSPDTSFLKASLGNKEAIWQLQPVNTGWNTEDARAFIIPAAGPGTGNNVGVYLSSTLLSAFEPGDQRRATWVDSTISAGTVYYYPYKYKVGTYGQPVSEYLTVLRLAEVYLIRAEAKARMGDLAGAAADLNAIRARAGLPPIAVGADIFAAIMHERQVELFAELGQRWLDLKRTGSVDSVMSLVTPQKGGGSWKSYQQRYPLPVTDLQLDPNLKQNAGY